MKLVLNDRADYDWARAVLEERRLLGRGRVSLSPVWGVLDPARLAAWVLEDRLDIRLQVQLHRVLWPSRDRGA